MTRCTGSGEITGIITTFEAELGFIWICNFFGDYFECYSDFLVEGDSIISNFLDGGINNGHGSATILNSNCDLIDASF